MFMLERRQCTAQRRAGNTGPGTLCRLRYKPPTIVGDVWDLEAFATVALVGLKLNPQFAGARGEGDGPFVGLTRLVGGDRRGKS